MITPGDMLDLMLGMFEQWGIHCVRMNDFRAECRSIDQGFRHRIGYDAWYDRLAIRTEQNPEEGMLCLYQDELHMAYSIFSIPEHLVRDCGCRVLTMGPMLFGQDSDYDIPTIMHEVGINSGYLEDITEFYNQAALSPGSQTWIDTLRYFLQRLCGDTPVSFIQIADEPDGIVADVDYTIPREPDMALTMIENRYKAENALIHAVAAGNYDESMERCKTFLQHRLRPRSSDALRDKKNICFVFNTLMRKAAELGGVHPMHIDNLSRQFAIQIEGAISVEQVRRLQYVMIRKYCLLVQNYSRSSYPPLVQNCMNIIDFYYNADLSLSWLAGECSVSESHLSSTFRRETGQTITEYINQTRVRQSLILLNATSLSIGEIAARCGFYDANYFSRIFRKIEGKSPKEYRLSMRGA